MRIAELCAGYGGLFLALQHVRPGAELAWYAEIDHDAMNVMESHHPHIPLQAALAISSLGVVVE